MVPWLSEGVWPAGRRCGCGCNGLPRPAFDERLYREVPQQLTLCPRCWEALRSGQSLRSSAQFAAAQGVALRPPEGLRGLPGHWLWSGARVLPGGVSASPFDVLSGCGVAPLPARSLRRAERFQVPPAEVEAFEYAPVLGIQRMPGRRVTLAGGVIRDSQMTPLAPEVAASVSSRLPAEIRLDGWLCGDAFVIGWVWRNLTCLDAESGVEMAGQWRVRHAPVREAKFGAFRCGEIARLAGEFELENWSLSVVRGFR